MSDTTCSICLEPITSDEVRYRMCHGQCNFYVHKECSDRWSNTKGLDTNNTLSCVICKKECCLHGGDVEVSFPYNRDLERSLPNNQSPISILNRRMSWIRDAEDRISTEYKLEELMQIFACRVNA